MQSSEKNDLVTWKNHAVRLLDGTTFRLKQTPDLVKTYGQASNGRGRSLLGSC